MSRLRADQLTIPALVLLALVVRALFAGINELAHDEPFTVYQAHRPLAELWTLLRHENNPALFFLVMKAWLPLAGTDAALLRMPSVVASAFTVWPLYLVARELSGRVTGFTAALLFICSSYHQGFAHEVRAYALFGLLATTGIWQLVRMAIGGQDHAPPLQRTWWWLALCNVLMVHTHFFGWLMVGVQASLLLGVPPLRRTLHGWTRAIIVTMVAFIPYAAIYLDRVGSSMAQGTWLTVPPLEEVYNMLWRWSNAPVIAVGFLVIIGIGSFSRLGRGPLWRVGLLWGMLPLVGLFLVSQWFPVFLDRYLLFAAPGFCLLVAHALATLPLTLYGNLAAAAVGVVAMAITFQPDKPSGLSPSRVVAVAKAMGKDRAPVLIAPPWYALTYAWHTDPGLFRHRGSWADTLAVHQIHPVHAPAHPPIEGDTATTLVLVDAWSELTDPDGILQAALLRTHPQVDRVEADHKVLVLRFRR